MHKNGARRASNWTWWVACIHFRCVDRRAQATSHWWTRNFFALADPHYYGCAASDIANPPPRPSSWSRHKGAAYTGTRSIQNVIKSWIHRGRAVDVPPPPWPSLSFATDFWKSNRDNASLRGLLFLPVTSLPLLAAAREPTSTASFIVSTVPRHTEKE